MKLNEPLVFKTLENKFEEFIDDKQNRQILFSGPFGSGKTTFLNNFFASRKNFQIFKLFPVNYVLHDNVDIYEIIKYDIIIELINKHAFEEVDIDNLTRYIYSFSQNLESTIAKLLSYFIPTGKPLTEVAEILEKSYEKNQEDFKKLNDPLLSIRSFKETIDKVKKYAYEDYVTTVIKEKLAAFSKKETQNILIVDDLDRVDPEHLFRIISVFSAHIDQDEHTNKFGFDKVIFVGDNENFQKMFIHRYGMTNSYNAYISKLCSKSPFVFDPDNELYYKLQSILKGIYFYHPGDDENEYFNLYYHQNHSATRHHNYILNNLVKQGVISLRELVKFQGKHPITGDHNKNINEFNDSLDSFSFYYLYIILRLVLPSKLSQTLAPLVSSPLPSTKGLRQQWRNGKQANIELSISPLEFLFANQYGEASGTDPEAVDLNFEGKLIRCYRFKKRMAGPTSISLDEFIATEEMIMKLVIAAVKKMEYYIEN